MTEKIAQTVPQAALDETAIAKAHAIYTPAMLLIYDVLVHGLSNHVAWRCSTRRITELYRANLSRQSSGGRRRHRILPR